MQANKTSLVKLAQKFCNKNNYTLEDFFQLYEYVNDEKGFDKFGALNPVGSWMIRSFLYSVCEDKFEGEATINPAYLGEVFFISLKKNESFKSFLEVFNNSKQEWFKKNKQYIGIVLDKP